MGSLAQRWMLRLVAAGPWLLLPAVAAVIAARWEAWPRAYPVHGGLGGPGRLVELSTRSVAAPLCVALLLLVWLELVRAHVLRHGDPTLDGGRTLRVVGAALRGIQWMTAAGCSAVALPSTSAAPAVVALAVALVAVPVGVVVGSAPGEPPPSRRHPPPGGWLYVPRAAGVGFAISRGHPAAARAWVIILGPPLAILALSRLLLA